MIPTLTALLYLGEIDKGREALVWEGPHPQPDPGQSGDPRAQEAHREEGSAQVSGQISHRVSLPGLSVGLRTRVQAGKSVPRCPRSHLFTGDKGPSHGQLEMENRSGLTDGE